MNLKNYHLILWIPSARKSFIATFNCFGFLAPNFTVYCSAVTHTAADKQRWGDLQSMKLTNEYNWYHLFKYSTQNSFLVVIWQEDMYYNSLLTTWSLVMNHFYITLCLLVGLFLFLWRKSGFPLLPCWAMLIVCVCCNSQLTNMWAVSVFPAENNVYLQNYSSEVFLSSSEENCRDKCHCFAVVLHKFLRFGCPHIHPTEEMRQTHTCTHSATQ